MFDEYEVPVSTRKSRLRSQRDRSSLYGGTDWKNQDFVCLHCHGYVSTHITLAGVQHRNHCPYCLWSRHMDLALAGDRLSACKAAMRPVGLTQKMRRLKYGFEQAGEIMLVHFCTDCERFSINRIAADDDAERMMKIFDESLRLADSLRCQLGNAGIKVLRKGDLRLVEARLYGR